MDDAWEAVRLEPKRHKLDVFDYHRLGDVGILGEDSRVELIVGELYDMAPIGSDHSGMVNAFNRVLVLACGERAVVGVQNPVRLDKYNEPQPDFAVMLPRQDMYQGRHAGPADILLLVEVANSSLKFDKTVKLPVYARAGIGEVWVVDLVNRTIEAHQVPVDGGYSQTKQYAFGEHVALALAPDISFRLPIAFG